MSMASSAFKRLRGLYRIVFGRMREHEARLFGGVGRLGGLGGLRSSSGQQAGARLSGEVSFRGCRIEQLEPRLLLDGSGPQIVGHWPAGLVGSADHVDITFSEPIDPATLSAGGVLVIPSSPLRLGGYATASAARGAVLAGNLAYVAEYRSGLQIIDISNPSAPALLGGYDTTGSAYGVAVSGSLAYVADFNSGLQVIDITNPASPQRVGGYDTTGFAFGVAVSGTLAYIAGGSVGLQVIDVSNPAAPVLLATYNTAGSASGVQVVGNLAYVADGVAGLQILDMSAPSSPVLLGTCDTAGNASGVTVSGNLAYVSDGVAGLQIIDVSDPSAPVLVGTCDTAGTAYSVTVDGTLAYVADYDAGLQVIDVSNPAAPLLLSAYDTAGTAYGVAASGGRAYVADGTAGLQIIEVAKAATGVTAVDATTYRVGLAGVLGSGTYNVRVYPSVTDLAGNAMDQDGDGVGGELPDDVYSFSFTVDMTPPTAPAGLAFTDDTGVSAADGLTSDTELSFTWSASTDAGGIARYEYRLDGGAWTATTELSAIVPVTAGPHTFEVRAIDNSGNIGPAASRAATVDLTAPSAPASPAVSGSVLSWSAATDANGIWKYQYRVNGGAWIDAAASPVNTGTLVGSGAVLDVRAIDKAGNAGPWATVQQPDYGPRVVGHWPDGSIPAPTDHIDITFNEPIDPATFSAEDVRVIFPTLTTLGSYVSGDIYRDVAVSGDLAFITKGTGPGNYGLTIFDISDPSTPVLIGSCVTPSVANDLVVSGNLVYIAGEGSGLVIIDVSDPTAPFIRGNYNTTGTAIDVALSGNTAFVADTYGGLQIINVSNPSAPSLLYTYRTTSDVTRISVSGQIAYVATYSSGLQLLNISIPQSPVYMGTYASNYVCDVAVSGSVAYVANGQGGFLVLDVSNPANPRKMSSLGMDTAVAISVSENFAYVSSLDSSVKVVDISKPSSPVVVARYGVSYPLGVAYSEGRIYAASWLYGLRIADVFADVVDLMQTGPQTWRVAMAQPMAEGMHRVWVGPGVADIAGHLMDQDADGIGGETGDDTYSFTITVDTTPPTAPGNLTFADNTGSSASDNLTNDTSLVFSWTASTDASGIVGYQYRLDGGDWTAAPQLTAAVAVGEGDHLFEVRGMDLAGNAGIIAFRAVTVDTTAPSAVTGLHVDATVLGWQEAEDSNGIWKYQYRINGGDWIDSLATSANTGLAGGEPATFDVRAVDLAGNVGPAASFSTVVDRGPRVTAHWPEGLAGAVDHLTLTFNEPINPDTLTPESVRVFLPAPMLKGQSWTGGNAQEVVVAGGRAYVAAYNCLSILDISNPVAPIVLGTIATVGDAVGVAVQGAVAYVADRIGGLQIFDVSDPAAPSLLGSHSTHAAFGVSVVGNLAYVADVTDGLVIVDVSDPTAPVRIGAVAVSGGAQGVTVVGQLAYVAARTNGLKIYDVSNLTAPTLLGTCATGGEAYRLAVSGTRAYVACDYAGLKIIDISNPVKPVVLGGYNTPDDAMGLAVSGELVYVAVSNHGVFTIDASNPAATVLLGKCSTRFAVGVALAGDMAYIADHTGGLKVLEVSRRVTGVTQVDDITYRLNFAGGASDGPWAVRVYPNIADQAGNAMDQDADGEGGEAVDDRYFFDYIVDTTPPTAPVGLSLINDTGYPDVITAAPVMEFSWSTPADANGVSGYEYRLDGGQWTAEAGLSATVTGAEGPRTFEVRAIDNVGNVGPATSLSVVVDLTAPGAPAITGMDGAVLEWVQPVDTNGIWKYEYRVDGGPWLQSLALQGDTGVADHAAANFEVRAIDRAGNVSPAGSAVRIADYGPRIVGHTPVGLVGQVDSITVTFNEPIDLNTFGPDDLRMVLASPSRLQLFATVSGQPQGMTVSGNMAYLAADSAGLRCYDITNPGSPIQLGTYDTPGDAIDVAISGYLAYVADDSGGIQIIDVSNPSAPTRVGGYSTAGPARAVVLSHSLLYVACEAAGLEIIDVSDPSAPVLVGSYDTPGSTWDVAVLGSRAYVADSDSGMQIIDISDFSAPALLGTYDTPGIARGVKVSGNVAYVADASSGVQIIDVSDPSSPVLLSNYQTDYCQDIELSGDLLYVSDWGNGIRVLDVSDPTNPVQISKYNASGYSQDIALAGNIAFVCAHGMGVHAVKVLDYLPNVSGITQMDAFTYRINLTEPLASGEYYIYISPDLTDLAGNTMDQNADGIGGQIASDTHQFHFSVDVIPPAAPGNLAFTDDTGSVDNVTASTLLTFSWDAVSDVSGIAGYEYRLDGGAWTWTTDTSGMVATAEGGHRFEGRAIDNIGNIGATAALDFVVDQTAPAAPTGLDLDGAVLNWDQVADTNGIWKYEYRIDGGDWSEVFGLQTPTGLAEGGSATTFDVRAIDKAGNDGTWASATLTPDYGPRVVSHSPDGLVGSVTSLTLMFNEPIDPSTLTAEDVTITPAAPVEVGYQDTPGTAYNIQVIGTLAYMADYTRGLRIIDVSNPAAPVEVGCYDTPGEANVVQVVGTLAYVADRASGLRIIDVSNPATPFELGYYDPSWNVYDVQVIGTLAYVANSLSGLKILDVSNPATPVEIGGYTMPHDALAVQVMGTMAYVADSAAGLRIIDVSNPAAPVQMGYYYTPGQANDVNVVGTLAYVTDSIYGIRIIDVSNPATPVEVGYYDTPGDCNGVQVIGTLAYVVDGSYGVRIIDMANPASPVQVSYYNTPGYAYGVHVVGTLAYVADGASGLRILETRKEIVGVTQVDDVTFRIDLADPLAEGQYQVRITPTATDLAGNTMDQDRDGIGGETPDDVYAFTITVDATPRVISHAPDGVTGPVSYIDLGFSEPINPASLAGGVRVLLPAPVNISGLGADGLAGAPGAGGYAYGVAVAGNVAYVADESRGLQIVDVSNPSAPVRLGGYDTAGCAHSVAVSGTLAYVADYAAGLQIIDVSDPSAPQWLGGYDTAGYAYGVAISGGLAYVADYSAGLQIIDVSNPSAPQRLGVYNTAGFAFGVALSGNLAYVADGSKGLAIIDVSNPAAPKKIGGLDTAGSAMGVAVWGNLAFVADYTAGVQVIDVSNPAAPVLVGTYDTAGAAYGVTVSGPLAFVADYGAGLVVLDMSNPSAPQLVAGLDTPGAARAVAVSGTRAYVADETAGLQVINVLAEVAGVTQTGDATYRIDLPGALPDGEYHVFVGPDVTDLAGNAMDQNANGFGGEMADAFGFSFTTTTAASPVPAAGAGNGGQAASFGIPGDVNGDGLVDSADYIALKRMMCTHVAAAGQWPDFDGSGVVDRGDLARVMANMGRSVSAETVPAGGASAAKAPLEEPAASPAVAAPSPAVADDAAATVSPAIVDVSGPEPAGAEPASAISSTVRATSDHPITSTSASTGTSDDVLAMSAAALLGDRQAALTTGASAGSTLWDLAESGVSLSSKLPGVSLAALMPGLRRPRLERIAVVSCNTDVLAGLTTARALSEMLPGAAPAGAVDLLLLKPVGLDVLASLL